MHSEIPSETKVVIVGGGIVGSSIAYHLAKLGWKDVVLLEQNELAGGTTWHAAGLVGRLRTTNSMTKINKYSAELYSTLEKETGLSTGWKQVGSLIVGKSPERMIQLQRTAAMSAWFGVEIQMISPEEAFDKWPLLRVDDVMGAAWLPHDGKVIPKNLCLALAKGAQLHGARVCEHVRVEEVLHKDGRAYGVKTDKGIIKAEYVVLSGGMWTRELGRKCGVTIPLYPVEHHYVLSNEIEAAFDELPVGRDPDLCIYFRGEGKTVMLGAFQKYTKPWMVNQVPNDFSFKLLEPDWEKYSEPLANGKWRIPALETSGFSKFVNGPESFTPDNNFIMGEAPELKNLFVCAGFNSVGIASAGGAGKYLAEWMIEGQPTLDLWSVDIRRFLPFANNLNFLRERVTEVLGLHYQMAWPNREFETGRGLRLSPLHETLAEAGACFGVKNGWERPNWFARSGLRAEMVYSFGRQNWFEAHAAEHKAAREGLALFDQTGFSKLLCEGPDALKLLQRVCGNDVDVDIGKVVYTGMFNQNGGIESDLTVIRLGLDKFYLVTGSAQTIRDANWINRNRLPGEQATLADVTDAFAIIGVMGPHSREFLQSLTDSDLSNAAFPFGTSREIAVGFSTVRAVRITYVGELGWELHVPTGQALTLYKTLWGAGQKWHVQNAGHYAINSLRMEKGYRAWGAELSPDDTPLEAGLSFAIAWNKAEPFIGRERLLSLKSAPRKRTLAIFVLKDPEPMLWGSEPIWCNGERVGYTTSGSYGHTVGGAICMGYINKPGINQEFIEKATFEIELNGKKMPAIAYLKPPYDPERKRILS